MHHKLIGIYFSFFDKKTLCIVIVMEKTFADRKQIETTYVESFGFYLVLI